MRESIRKKKNAFACCQLSGTEKIAKVIPTSFGFITTSFLYTGGVNDSSIHKYSDMIIIQK